MLASKRFEVVIDPARKHPGMTIDLPKRATSASQGYDFFSLEYVMLHPGVKYKFWTDVKVHLGRGEELFIGPRSSAGIEKNLMLANTIGFIDPDYCGCKANDGNICICMFNYGPESVEIKKRDRFAQGFIMPVVVDEDDGPMVERTGGLGSTGQ